MKSLIVVAALTLLGGCGVETATTAATGAAAKQREVEEARKTVDQARGDVAQALDQAQRRAGHEDGK